MKKNIVYKLKDISIIIPTYNRSEELKETILSFKNYLNKIGEVLIVDQSKDEKTKKLINNFRGRLKYIYSPIPSLTKARNIGVKESSKKTKIICFIDDDVTIKKGYFEEIINSFNIHPGAKCISGWNPQPPGGFSKYENFLKKIFLLDSLDKNKAKVLSSYGKIYPFELVKDINAQWTIGINMSYKKEIFNEQCFDENLPGYALAEDFDFSYRLYKKYPFSIIITPRAKCIHRSSSVERYPTPKMAYSNQINHFYLQFKNFNYYSLDKIKFVWALTGILVLRVIYFSLTRKKEDNTKLKLFIKSVFYCISNLDKIRKGHLELPVFER